MGGWVINIKIVWGGGIEKKTNENVRVLQYNLQ